MFNTHIKHTIQRWIVSNGTLLELIVLATGASAGAIATSMLSAHFLQQPLVVWQETGMTRMDRLQIHQREIAESLVAVTNTDAEPTITLETEPLRAAADEEPSLSSSSSESPSSSATASSEAMSSEASSADASSSEAPAVPSSSSEAASSSSVTADTGFPAFGNAIQPVSRVPDWGFMKTPAEWNRTYKQMRENDFVRVPAYDLSVLTIPVKTLADDRDNPETIKALTAKLYYSTRFFGAYDLDANEFSAVHPGIDLKLPEGTPVGAVAGGRVHDVRRNEETLGLHVIIEHRTAGGETFYSIYGHLGAASVKAGDTITAGQMIGTVGMSGNTSGAHLHLQIDRGEAEEAYHTPYWPASLPSRSEANLHTVNPATFVVQY